jgi:acetyl-CoA C-acetyltransferase
MHLGNVVTGWAGRRPGGRPSRAASPITSPPSINKVCGSGRSPSCSRSRHLRALDIAVAVNESMSSCPYLLPRVREGCAEWDVVDSMIHGGLWCPVGTGMGTREVVAECFKVTREQQDTFAALSHQRAAAAHASGKFKAEMLPVSIPQKKGDPLIFDRDESVRAATTAETLRALKPAFKKDGSVTAGNAPPVNDGAAALVVMSSDRASELGLKPLARIIAQATSGLQPKMLLMTPVEATRKVLAKAGWKLDEVDLFELNEAFAVQAVAVGQQLGLDMDRST